MESTTTPQPATSSVNVQLTERAAEEVRKFIAAEQVPVLVEDHRLRRGGTEIDADDAVHAADPARLASIIWK